MSTIPAFLDALATTAKTATGLLVGQGTLLNTQHDFVIIGYDEDTQPAVKGRRVPTNAGPVPGEAYTVHNLISTWIGDADPKPARDKLFTHLDEIDAAFIADETLGVDAVITSGIGDFELAQPITGQGAVAVLHFYVDVTATTL